MSVEVKFTKLFYANEWHDSVSSKSFETLNPADGVKLADVAEADQVDVNIAVDLAKKASNIHCPLKKLMIFGILGSAETCFDSKIFNQLSKTNSEAFNYESIKNGIFSVCAPHQHPPITEHVSLHSKSIRKNMARASGGANNMHPKSQGGGDKRQRSKKKQ